MPQTCTNISNVIKFREVYNIVQNPSSRGKVVPILSYLRNQNKITILRLNHQTRPINSALNLDVQLWHHLILHDIATAIAAIAAIAQQMCQLQGIICFDGLIQDHLFPKCAVRPWFFAKANSSVPGSLDRVGPFRRLKRRPGMRKRPSVKTRGSCESFSFATLTQETLISNAKSQSKHAAGASI